MVQKQFFLRITNLHNCCNIKAFVLSILFEMMFFLIQSTYKMAVIRSFSGKNHPDSFHSSIRPLLILGQICGLLPIKGIFGSSLRFSWKDAVHVYAFIIFLVTLFLDTCYTTDNFKSNIRIDVFASTVFYTVCLMTTIFFLQIAKEFPYTSNNFAEVEKQMMDYGYPKRLGFKIKLFLFSFILFATVEHGTMVVITVKYAWTTSGPGEFLHTFYNRFFPAITKRLPYTGLGTIVLFWVNVICTFNWNYLDFFIIVISMETYSRIALINERLHQGDYQGEDRLFWDKILRDYNRMSLLTKSLDKKLSKIILTSFFSNMYHLSLQLVRSLKMSGSLFQVTYFYCSLTYLALRLLLVLFFVSKIHQESKKPAELLSELEKPCPEAIRFWHQVLTDDIAFTGARFFVINRRFLLSIIGTLMTYQGVLLQFNSLQGATQSQNNNSVTL